MLNFQDQLLLRTPPNNGLLKSRPEKNIFLWCILVLLHLLSLFFKKRRDLLFTWRFVILVWKKCIFTDSVIEKLRTNVYLFRSIKLIFAIQIVHTLANLSEFPLQWAFQVTTVLTNPSIRISKIFDALIGIKRNKFSIGFVGFF